MHFSRLIQALSGLHLLHLLNDLQFVACVDEARMVEALMLAAHLLSVED